MGDNKIVSLNALRTLKRARGSQAEYEHAISKMDKLELLNEMVRFQEERTKNGQLTPDMLVRGRILFTALESTAETQALKILTRSYRRHLEHEIHAYMETGKSPAPLGDDDYESSLDSSNDEESSV